MKKSNIYHNFSPVWLDWFNDPGLRSNFMNTNKSKLTSLI